jgi:tetratricopeptide (TPR) repeat protein
MSRHWPLLPLLSLCGLLGCSASAAFYHQGLRALDAGDYAQATHALSLALVEEPQHVGALTVLGLAHYHQGAVDAAIDALERAQALAPDDPRIQLYLGLAALKQGQVDQARHHFAAFLERTRNRALQEQALRVISVLDEPTLSDAVRAYLADSLDTVFQQAQQVEALRQEVHTLEAQQGYRPIRRIYGIRRRR